MTYYFAVFLSAEEGGFVVRFPDLPEAITQGDTFEEAMDMAKDVLAVTVEEYVKARKLLPKPQTVEDAIEWGAVHAHDEGINPSGPAHVQAFAAPNIDATPVRISVSLPKAVLDEIDAKAHQSGLTRSGFLAQAARAYEPMAG